MRKRISEGPVTVRVGRHKTLHRLRRHLEKVAAALIPQVEAIPDGDAEHIFPLPQIRSDIKHHILDLPVIVRPAGIQLMIAYLFAVDVKSKLSQPADQRVGALYLLCQIPTLFGIKRFPLPRTDPQRLSNRSP